MTQILITVRFAKLLTLFCNFHLFFSPSWSLNSIWSWRKAWWKLHFHKISCKINNNLCIHIKARYEKKKNSLILRRNVFLWMVLAIQHYVCKKFSLAKYFNKWNIFIFVFFPILKMAFCLSIEFLIYIKLICIFVK